MLHQSPSRYPKAFTILACVTGLLLSPGLSSQALLPYTAEQAEAGHALYRLHCQKCHGSTLANGQFGTPLKGAFFRLTWQEKSVGELLDYLYEEMPSDVPSRLTREEYAQLAAWIFEQNEFASSGEPLQPDPAATMQLLLPF